MKNIILLGLAIFLFASCDNQEKRYTQQSPEIETYKKVIAAYEKQEWQEMKKQYADTAKIMNNVIKKNGQSIEELIETDKGDATLFSSWDYVDAESEYEMVLTDEGETWVNFWGLWKGTLKSNGQTYEIPAHITTRYIDGKIVREFGYWDNTKLMIDIQKSMEMAESMSDSIPK